MPAKLNSSQLWRHAGGEDSHGLFCWRLLFSYRNGVAVMSQSVRQYMRTRVYFRVSTGLSEADPFFVTTGYPSRNCRLQWYNFITYFSYFFMIFTAGLTMSVSSVHGPSSGSTIVKVGWLQKRGKLFMIVNYFWFSWKCISIY